MSNRGRHHKNKRIIGAYSWISKVLSQEVILKMLRNQVDAGNDPDLKVFENDPYACTSDGGFIFSNTPEGRSYWINIAHELESYKIHNL